MELLTPPDSAISLGYDRRGSLANFSRSPESSPREHNGGCEAPCTILTSEDHGSTSLKPAGLLRSPIIVPKVEELEEILDSMAAVENAKPPIERTVLPEKKRGRPRKHPEAKKPQTGHARSKTGCVTCRKRKKKCDEARPDCMNCQKNNVVCEGYSSRQLWRSGRERALEQAEHSLPPPLPPLTYGTLGIETPEDHIFLRFYMNDLAPVLSMKDENQTNPFLGEIFEKAKGHQGLMESLLYISSSSQICQYATVNIAHERRRDHHYDKAISILRFDMDHMSMEAGSVQDESVAQALLLCLQTVCAGDLGGAFRMHLRGMKTMLTKTSLSTQDSVFLQFVREFLVYHEYSSAITEQQNTLDSDSMDLLSRCREWSSANASPNTSQAGTLLGVLDGFFEFIQRIRALRDKIRPQRILDPRFVIFNDVDIYVEARNIDCALRRWDPGYHTNSPRYLASLLYRQCAHLYLQRTCWPSERYPTFKQEVDKGLEYLRKVPWDKDSSATQSILLMPVFLLGCSAFEPEQRPEIAQTFERLEEWSRLRNIRHARAIVEEIWQMMDDGRVEETWDWEALIAKKQWSFLVT